MRLSDLKLRSPGYGKPDDDSFASPGFAGVAGVPAIDVHLQEHGCGLQAMQLVLREALPGTGPIVWLRNGRRSNISNVEWFPGLTFQGGHPAGAVIRDEGQETLLRACRGAADRHAADRDAVNGERPAGEQRAKADELP